MNLNLYYAVNCGKNCDFYTKNSYEEEWKPAKLYDEVLTGYQVSNLGALKKGGEFVNRRFTEDGEIAVKIDTEPKEVYVYKIVASTFLEKPADGYEDKDGHCKKGVHHYDNNSYNFIPDNMKFVTQAEHLREPHLCLKNITAWDEKIKQICAKK